MKVPQVTQHLAKFRGLKHYGSIGKMFLMVEEKDSTCHLLPPLLVFSKARDMTCCHTKFRQLINRKSNLPMRSMKYVCSWLHMSTAKTDGAQAKNFYQSVSKQQLEGKRKERLLQRLLR